MKILLEISFLGSAYCGYQVQPDLPTIQGQLNAAAKDLFGFDCDIVGCSRTDSGVHANQFFLTVAKKGEKGISTKIPIEKIPLALSVRLPRDISVKSASFVDDSFHARYSVRYKEYLYVIWNSSIRDPFEYDRSWQYERYIDGAALNKMNAAAQHFVGTHDFAAYMASNTDVENTVRTIFSAELYREGDKIYFKVSADGFLYNMVRILTGTLISVAEGKLSPEDIDAITDSKSRKNAGMTAPAQGLFLNRVVY